MKTINRKNSEKIIKDIYAEAKKYNCNIFIPEDCNVSTDFKGYGKIKKQDAIGIDEMILDIGPKTIKNL